MSKPKALPVGDGVTQKELERYNTPANEPLSGSKKVKKRNHSRQNHGEGR
ncbi:small acid-soluble spore protein P [Paenibacillus chitinolyticus]|uniref:Small acid-soluble spore protein P n=1 Tax=Paenibacillus chitinolyticus TaxID=79263 RepID=A0A410WQ65_9BACL|nr:small acid-soluble spore protein P [Paenibacillus chitinolyticus]MCY9591785.1 small acid-soluble spore protein P [Paenibacillus chitinolyticus]MCY9596144.1 small acid-soluble spore protein P [Paenibacillus chitinolyticus]QAV16568.1 small acid-soluble spore protein P [Paenibacillus chitinolyticus]